MQINSFFAESWGNLESQESTWTCSLPWFCNASFGSSFTLTKWWWGSNKIRNPPLDVQFRQLCNRKKAQSKSGALTTRWARAQYNKKLWCNSGQYWLKRLFIATESLESSNNLFSPFFVSFSTRWLNTAKPPCFCGCSLRASYFITWPLCLTLGAQSIKRSFTSVGGVSAAKKWN